MYSYGRSSSNHKRIYSEQHSWPKIKASTLCFILQFLWKRKQTLAFMLRYFESKEAIFFGFSFFITNSMHMCFVSLSRHPKTYYVRIKYILNKMFKTSFKLLMHWNKETLNVREQSKYGWNICKIRLRFIWNVICIWNFMMFMFKYNCMRNPSKWWA